MRKTKKRANVIDAACAPGAAQPPPPLRALRCAALTRVRCQACLRCSRRRTACWRRSRRASRSAPLAAEGC
eukprot:3110936-Rhodomonas_salina.1